MPVWHLFNLDSDVSYPSKLGLRSCVVQIRKPVKSIQFNWVVHGRDNMTAQSDLALWCVIMRRDAGLHPLRTMYFMHLSRVTSYLPYLYPIQAQNSASVLA